MDSCGSRISNRLDFCWPRFSYSDWPLSICQEALYERIIANTSFRKTDKKYAIVKKGTVLNIDGRNSEIPKTLFLTDKVAIISLGITSHSSTGKSQKKITIGYDVLSGNHYFKKLIFSDYEMRLLKFLRNSFNEKKPLSVAQPFPYNTGCKRKFWEKKGEQTLKEWLTTNYKLNLDSLLALQNTIKIFHLNDFSSSSLSWREGKSRPLFHGDISLNNIVCDFDAQGNVSYKLIDYEGGRIKNLSWTKGWCPPEYIAYCLKQGLFAERSISEFNEMFGQKKDAWSLALVIGSILRGYTDKTWCEAGLPAFSFITKRIVINDGKLDEKKLLTLTQKEIDDEIAEIKNSINEDVVPDEGLRKILLACWEVINGWLTVDPQKRPTVAELSLTVSKGRILQ